MKFKSGTVGLTAIVLAALAGCGTATSAGPEDTVERTSATPSPRTTAATAHTRLSSADLQGRWWTWAASEPESTNPVADQDGSACGRNQPRDVWFLAGTFGTRASRTCTVPDGVPVAFPLVNVFGSPEDCALFMRTAKGSAVLDGEQVDSDVHRGEKITVASVANNAVTGTAGRGTTTGCGLWVQLPPLEPGPHSLKIRGRSDDFSTGVDYALTVEGASD